MSVTAKIRQGRGPFWGGIKRIARRLMTAHLPVNRVTRPFWRGLYAVHVAIRDGWIATRRFFWNEPLFRSQCEAIGAQFQMEEIPFLTGRGRIVIGSGVRLSGKSGIGFTSRVTAQPELKIGDKTFVGHDCSFSIAKAISIGRNCLLAGGVSIRDYDGHPLDAEARRAGEFVVPEAVRPVAIGDDVWLGSGVRVLKGVTIGDRAIVAAGSIVVKDVPADSVVAGSPARVVKHLTPSPEGATRAGE
ncbi:DapH/DapD/GlmU-related protein [Botrimarina mediterranea]|uniref:DapH/DapD/GlmU-related protein n=1 Tax=Botrimarina mediterranea TaxID=2528022 RepID=UPI00118B0062|nr:Maltose O-acetyltransferase [Planctomycetes bacterium K2D]